MGHSTRLEALAVGRRAASGLPLLVNTSFNTKGRPILNTAAEAVRLLCALPDLDYVAIEGWLFDKGGCPAAELQ